MEVKVLVLNAHTSAGKLAIKPEIVEVLAEILESVFKFTVVMAEVTFALVASGDVAEVSPALVASGDVAEVSPALVASGDVAEVTLAAVAREPEERVASVRLRVPYVQMSAVVGAPPEVRVLVPCVQMSEISEP